MGVNGLTMRALTGGARTKSAEQKYRVFMPAGGCCQELERSPKAVVRVSREVDSAGHSQLVASTGSALTIIHKQYHETKE